MLLIHSAFGNRYHGLMQRQGIGFHRDMVKSQEKQCRGDPGSLVAIETRLGLRNVESVGCCQIKEISDAEVVSLSRLEDGSFERTAITNADSASE